MHVSYFRIFRHFGSQSLPHPPMDAQASTEDLLGLDVNAHFGAPISRDSLSIHERMMTPETHATVTCGAPTAHALGLSDCGLREMELEMHSFQSVLEKSTPRLMGAQSVIATATFRKTPPISFTLRWKTRRRPKSRMMSVAATAVCHRTQQLPVIRGALLQLFPRVQWKSSRKRSPPSIR